ncbi:MAG: bifunctional adenosylcobinamide kinase/adenosylcobinamide-phosphate guanylyltransferase, partial [Nitrospirota bacterium]
SLAEREGGRLVYIATAQARDPEMAERIRRHREARGTIWESVEEPENIAEAVSAIGGGTVIIDCLTLWLSNLMEKRGSDGFEETASSEADSLAGALKSFKGVAIVVSNELGSGIVPLEPAARAFRDAAGRVNQIIAQASDEAYLVASGLPVRLK